MISTEEELLGAYAALGNLYRAVAALKNELGDGSPAFALLSEGPVEEIDKLTGQIQDYTGVTRAISKSAPLWMRLVGTKARWRDTSASALTAFLDAIRKGVQAVAGYNTTRASLGRPGSQLQKACDFRVTAFLPGSLQLGMALPEPSQHELFATHRSEELRWSQEAERALSEFLIVARWASSDESQRELETSIPDLQKRRVLLRAVKPLVPRSRGGIEYIELSGPIVPQRSPIYLSAASNVRLSSALEGAIATSEERFTGEIREMDLDRRTFRLRHLDDRPGEVSCHLPEDLGPITATFLGKRARVIGTRSTENQVLEIVDIEQLEPEQAE